MKQKQVQDSWHANLNLATTLQYKNLSSKRALELWNENLSIIFVVLASVMKHN